MLKQLGDGGFYSLPTERQIDLIGWYRARTYPVPRPTGGALPTGRYTARKVRGR